jgi:adenosine deaminase
MTDSPNWILKQPKLDLHCHLEGAVRASSVYALSIEQNIPLPVTSPEQIDSLVSADGTCSSLSDYLGLFDPIVNCIQTPDALRRVSFEIVEDAARNGVIYIELRFAPQLLRSKGYSCEAVVSAVLEGLSAGSRATGVESNAILICMRNHSYEQNREVLGTALSFRNHGVVAIDIAGDEAAYPPLMHMQLFDDAKQYDMPFTIHAGEAAGPENMKEALLLGAKRIGHGVRLSDDQNLLRYFAKNQIGMELCPTSNVQTHAVASMSVHPIQYFLNSGLKVTVNTDNPTISKTNMCKEYRILNEEFGLSEPEFEKLALNAVDICFADDAVKKRLRSKIELFYQR